MRHLYLLRHAKASWELAGELDYERGLTERGAADAELMRAPVQRLDPQPDLVICSGARRARETFNAIASVLPGTAEVQYDDRLYAMDLAQMIDALREISDERTAVLVVGHNPVLHDAAIELAASGDELEALAGKFPTSALAELAFDSSWSALSADSAELTAFTYPESATR